MRHGILVARRVTPPLSHTPRRCFVQPCVSTPLVLSHRTLLHAGSSAEADKKPKKDLTWVFDYAGPKIDSLDGGVELEGTEDFVTHEGGAKLISSWSVAPGDKPVIWVPGKPLLPYLATREEPSLVSNMSNVRDDSKAMRRG